MHREPAVAGMFYPGEPEALRAQIDGFLADARVEEGRRPKALIAPHAGTVYSGAVAATAYKLLEPISDVIERVVLVGPSHRVAFRGLAVPSVSAFDTPLGEIPLDRALIERLRALPQVVQDDRPHALEHSLEVHLPFLQRCLRKFSLLPVVVGDASTADVAEVLDAAWGGAETLLVVSSDLSHFLDYEAARRVDTDTCRAIEALEPERLDGERACGHHGLRGLLTTAKRRSLTIRTLDLRSSGDTAGPRDRVVGYGAWVLG